MRRLVLAALILGGCAAAGAGTDSARLSAQIAWAGQGEGFGGLSALMLAPNGGSLTALGDRGVIYTAEMERDGTGRLTGIVETSRAQLRRPDGSRTSWGEIDSESLTRVGDGFAVSLERDNAIWLYDAPDAVPRVQAVPPAFARLQTNSGIEALASGEDGTLYAIPERSGALDRPFPVYRLRGEVWDTELQLPRQPPYLPTGADIGPDGRLYVLERDFTGFFFRVQVRSFAIGADGLEDARLVLPPDSTLDNAEGIDVWRGADGGLRMTLISDDNFFPLQRTLISEFTLPPGG